MDVLSLIAGLCAAALAVYGAVCSLWLAVLTVAGCCVWRREAEAAADRSSESARLRMLILMPAHNEEEVIGEVLDGMRRALRWPSEQLEIVVIADNCTDRTAEIASARATVLVRDVPDIRGKGQALSWVIETRLRVWPRPFDAVVVVDADSAVNPGFLHAFQEAVERGHAVSQAHDTVWNVRDSWRTALMFAGFSAINYLRPLGRSAFGWSVGLKGNGMCFTRDVLLKYGHPAGSVAEDLEQGMRYLADGIRVAFVPGAVVRAKMPVGAKAAVSQRARWEGGRSQVARVWIPRLAGRFARGALSGRPDWAALDGALELLIPPLGNLGAVLAGAAALGWLSPWRPWVTGAALSALALAVAHFLVAQVLARAPGVVYVRLLASPVYVAWKLWTFLKRRLTRAGRGEGWVRTTRSENAGGGHG